MPDIQSEIEQQLLADTIKGVQNKKYNPNETAREIIQKHNMFFYGDSFFLYNGGSFIIQNDNQMKSIIHEHIRDDYRQAKYKEITECMIAQCLTDDINTYQGINVKNGILDLDTLELTPHTPITKSINQIKTDYDDKAECPDWLDFLSETLSDDPTKADVLQEYSGYCLDINMNLEILLFLLGRGANGKSVFLNTIQRVIGYNNCENLSLDDLKNKNYLAELLGKVINASTESQVKSEIYDSVLKRLASGEPIKVDRKFKHPFTFRSNCKHIYCLNQLPRVSDKTDAFFRRIIPIPFNYQVARDRQILGLDRLLAKEASGILNWMIKGYKRLKINGWRFTTSPQIEELLSDYRRENNNVLGFVDECCEIVEGFQSSNTDLYNKYTEWCKESGIKPVKKKSLISEIIHNFKCKRYKTDGIRGLKGIIINTIC